MPPPRVSAAHPGMMFGQPSPGYRIPPQREPHPSGGTSQPAGPVLHVPPAPGYAAATVASTVAGPAEDAGTALAMVGVRNQVADRMVALNYNHALLAWENRRAQPICPHAIAFLYADPVHLATAKVGTEASQWYRIAAATRVVHDSPDARELPNLLYRLVRLARERYLPTPGGFDPAVHMAVYHDEASGSAQFIGIGVSTLDAIDRLWEDACRAAEDVDDIGGRAFALLFDDTAILTDRGAPRATRGEIGVHSTGELHFPGDTAPRMWTLHPNISTMPVDREVWDLMHHLHQVVYRQNPRPTL